MSENGSSMSLGAPSRGSRWPTGIAIVIVTLCYAWAFWGSTHEICSERPTGYYALLTDALTSGQLHLKIEPDPRLAALPNPWAGAQGIPRVHDATYFNGHYYLYFGISPVLILLAPWHVLTGTFLAESLATTLFGWIGFLLAARLWIRLKQRVFPDLGAMWTAMGVAMIGLGNYVYFLLETPVFYHVPIVCAFMCVMIALNTLEAALNGNGEAGRRIFLISVASLLWALCVGARPNYAIGLPLFGAFVIAMAYRMGRERLPVAQITRLLAAAIVPAAVVGLGLAWYNYARFGNITEFGIKYQFASIDQRFLKLTDSKNFWPTLASYLTAGADYTPYYPFVEEKIDVIGLIRWVPFGLAAVLAPLTAWRLWRAGRNNWSGIIILLTLLTCAHLASLCILPFANDRYLVDFVPEAILLALVVSADWLQQTRRSRFVHAIVALLVIAVGGDTLVHANLLAIQRNAEPGLQPALARAGDYLAPLWERAFHIPRGRVDLTIRFRNLQPREVEPLVATGVGRDVVYVEYLPEQRVRFGFFHFGAGGPTSEAIPVEIDKPYHVSIDLGSLYPPAEHPTFRQWDQPTIDALHRRIQVHFEGRKVLQWTAAFYDSNPFLIQIGKNTKSPITARKFSGTIDSVHWQGMPSKDQVPSVPGDGPVRLTVKFPPFANIISQPLISTGRPGAGDLIYVTYLSPTRLRFGHDSWNAGAIETVEVSYDPHKTHTIDIDMGSLHANAKDLEASKYKLKIRFDNDYILSTYRPFHVSAPIDISLGYDTTRSTAASPFFTGSEMTATRIPELPDLAPALPGWGPVRLVVSHVAPLVGAREPLLVTGTPGAGDFIFLIYLDPTHIQIGYDHWGVGGVTSKPIEIDLTQPLDLKISTSALYPLAVSKEWSGTPDDIRKKLLSTTTVMVNGKIAIDYPMVAYSASANETYICANPIGGSSCNLMFTGSILGMNRLKVGTTLNAD